MKIARVSGVSAAISRAVNRTLIANKTTGANQPAVTELKQDSESLAEQVNQLDMRIDLMKRRIGTAMRSLVTGPENSKSNSELETRRQMLLELSQLSDNLNQISRGVNHANLTGGNIDPAGTTAKLIEIQEALERLS